MWDQTERKLGDIISSNIVKYSVTATVFTVNAIGMTVLFCSTAAWSIILVDHIAVANGYSSPGLVLIKKIEDLLKRYGPDCPEKYRDD